MTVTFNNVSFAYPKGKKQVLSNFNLVVEQGEFVSIVGRSGTGKSTIFKLLTGLLKQNAGEILVNNQVISPGTVGYMPQKDLLLPWRTILQNVMIATEIQKDLNITEAQAKNWLQRVGLVDYVNAYPKELSGGMRQRAAFLRALLTGKDVLLLDEPFGALDALTKKEMQAWLLSIWEDLNKTVLFITHDLEEAIYVSDRIIIIHPDQSIEEIAVHLQRPRQPDVFYSPEMIRLRQVLEGKISNG